MVETRNLFLGRLRHRVWSVEQENRDLLLGLLPDIHRSMNTGTRHFPVHLSRRDLDALALTFVAVFNRDEIASQHHGHPLTWIAMPRHSLAWEQDASDEPPWFVLKEDIVCHDDLTGIRLQRFLQSRGNECPRKSQSLP